MKIGIDASKTTISEKTGTENYSSSLIKSIALFDRENEYTLYCNSDKNINLVLQSNFREVHIPAKRLWTQYHLSQQLFREKQDLLFIPAHTLPFIRPKSIKTVVTIHDLGAEYLPQYHQFPHRIYLNKSTEYAIRYATHIIAVSQSTKKDIIHKSSRNESEITVIYEGYNNSIFNENSMTESNLNKNYKYNFTEPYLLFVGTVQPRKNLIRLIEVFSQLKNKQVKLVIVGKKGWLCEDIYTAPYQYGIKDKVIFLGYVNDNELANLYRNADGFVFPSLCEGFGIPLLEAMACGCPVLTSSVSSMPEIVGDAGILVDPYSNESIFNGLLELLNGKKKKEFREKGLTRVKNFSWEKAAEETIKVFNKVLAK